MKPVNIASISIADRYWVKTVTRKARKLKKENPNNPFFSNEEKTELFLKWKNDGCVKSRDKLLEALYPLALQQVHALVNRTGSNNVDVQDLEQEANFALVHCLEDYDPTLGTLPTFFRSRLPMFFYRALKDYGNFIRIPDNILKDISLENKAFERFIKLNGYYPNTGDTIELNGKNIVFGKKKLDTVVSGNTSYTHEDDTFELFDITPDKESVVTIDDTSATDYLNLIIDNLSKREQEIIKYTYYTDLDISEILFLLKPHSKLDYDRLYKRGTNVLKIETTNETLEYTFVVYNNAKKRSSNEIVCANNEIIPISHLYATNYQKTVELNLSFFAQNFQRITLNDKEVCYICEEIDRSIFKDMPYGYQQITIKDCLRGGTIYTSQNYSVRLNEIKDKIRKQITKNKNVYELLRETL